jgi:uncharacterized protein (TIGR03000 family)
MIRRMLVTWAVPMLVLGTLLAAAPSLLGGLMLPPYPPNSSYRAPRYYQRQYYNPDYAQPSYYAPQPITLSDSDVLFNVRVPASATVWVNGDRTSQTGDRRDFVSSDLTPGKSYTFDFKAQWTQGMKVIIARQRVKVHGGEQHAVNLLMPEARPAPASSDAD